ncbi:ankyrin repeat and SOCS box protein 1 [Mantella aurantiaca]
MEEGNEEGAGGGVSWPPGVGRNLKDWLRDQYCGRDLEQSQDSRLHHAACVGDMVTMRALLQEESFLRRINEKSVWCNGWLPCTPLRVAATAGHANCVALLLHHGAELELLDVKGQTPLFVATENGHLECVQVLLKAGANPNGSPHNRSTPVYCAARTGRADILEELIRYGADVDIDHQLSCSLGSSPRCLTSLSCTPLYISAAYVNLACFSRLLQAGANPDYNSWRVICEASFSRPSPSCLIEVVLRHGCNQLFLQLLIDYGANLSLLHKDPSVEENSRRKVNPETLKLFREARCCARTLSSLCRIAVRRALGKHRLSSIRSLPAPYRVVQYLLHEN